MRKAIVIGLDGLEPSIVEAMLGRGELPHFGRLRSMGSYTRLKTTYPAQTPTAWSSFATGVNPGGHGVFDFIRRDPQTYQPDYALSRFEPPRNAFSQPRVVNRRQGVPFWELLSKADIPSTILRCPVTFPPDSIKGRMLSGVGVPDLRGSQGTGTFYTQDRTVTPNENEMIVHLDSGDRCVTQVRGPRNPRANPPTDSTCEIEVLADVAGHKVTIKTPGTPALFEVAEGAWSPWVRLKFKLSVLQSVSGIARFYVRQVSPQIEFYISPINFDPAGPAFPISSPSDYAKELSERIGLFSTLGMAEDHNGLNNGRFDENAFLAQSELVLEERERMVLFELDRFTEGLFFAVFDTPDRVQHMFWRFRDPEHPGYDPDRVGEFSRRIEEHYRCCDALLGRVLERVDENTLLILLSDHGFNSFRRGFHTNTWLHQQGLLALREGKKPDEEHGADLGAVDWSRTHAYALGLGGVYLNLRGREGGGIVEEGGEAERVRQAIQEGLAGLHDPGTGQVAIRSVSRREEIYCGACLKDAPDLLVNYAPGFRVSWQTALGGAPHNLFEDNLRRWSGDHIIDPTAVPGILFLSCAMRHNHADIRDLAPTILSYFGVAPHSAMEGTSLI